ncbi:MAG: tetratricopeptide repeat protein, partial [Candidatus Eisenbacteria bacterium]|nr:tetratricopeptide repeat protein [Candidatus Latescibacterota bacterium]MBD3302581.1 tetratricopeptide repeat protein [Candidatus Eisenbacteria bacterium]
MYHQRRPFRGETVIPMSQPQGVFPMRLTARAALCAPVLAILLLLSTTIARPSETEEATPGDGPVSGERSALSDSLDHSTALMQRGAFAEAEALLRRLLEQYEAESGRSSSEVGRILDRLVVCLWQSGRSQEEETVQLASRAVEIKEMQYGSDHLEVATSLFNIGVIRAMGGDYAGAEPIFERILRIREASLPPGHHEIASSINALANIRFSRSDFAGSLPLYARALELVENSGGRLHPVAVSIRGNLANNYIQLGDYTEAQAILEDQIALLEAEGMETEDLAFAYSLLANIYTSLADHAEALSLRERCLEIRRTFNGEEHPRFAEALLNLGNELWHLGRYAEARERIERGRSIWEAIYGPAHTHISAFHEGLGRLAFQEGNLDESKRQHEIVLEIREETMGEDHPKVAEALRSLGRIAMREGRLADACTRLERALRIVSEKIGTDHTLAAEYGLNLAYAEHLRGDLEAAARRALEVEQISREHLRLTSRALPERQALRYAGSRSTGLDLLATILEKEADVIPTAQVWDALIRSRALVLDVMAERAQDRARHRDPDVRERLDAYRDASTRLANLHVRGPQDDDPGTYLATLESVRQEMEAAERELAAATGSGARETTRDRVGYEDVRRALPGGGALVAYLLHLRHTSGLPDDPNASLCYAAFILAPDAEGPIHVPLGPASGIDARISAWKREVSAGVLRTDREPSEALAAYRKEAIALREAIWDPVQPYLEGARRVFVVPDGQIHLINLATLPDEEGRYLIESAPAFHHLSAERELART